MTTAHYIPAVANDIYGPPKAPVYVSYPTVPYAAPYNSAYNMAPYNIAPYNTVAPYNTAVVAPYGTAIVPKPSLLAELLSLQTPLKYRTLPIAAAPVYWKW